MTPKQSLETARATVTNEPAPTEPETVLILRTCDAKRQGHNGFVWPESGPVSCPDWDPRPVCGFGLHGLLWGCGNGSLVSWEADAIWIVWEAAASDVVDIDGEKVKAPRGVVLYAGDRKTATDMIAARKPGHIVGADLTGGYGSTLTGGDYSTLTGGHRSTLTGGDGSTLTGGYGSTLTGGDYSTLTVRWYDGNRYRIATMYVGEGGIEANAPYKLDDKGKPVRVVKQ